MKIEKLYVPVKSKKTEMIETKAKKPKAPKKETAPAKKKKAAASPKTSN